MIKVLSEEDDDFEQSISELEIVTAQKNENFTPFWRERHRFFLGLIIEMDRKGPPTNHPIWDDVELAINELWSGQPAEPDPITISLIENAAEDCRRANHMGWTNRLDAVLRTFRGMINLKASARDDLREQMALARSKHAPVESVEVQRQIAEYEDMPGLRLAREQMKLGHIQHARVSEG